MKTGLDLKVERTRHRLQAKTVAEAMGISQSRISNIEYLAVVSDEIAKRYLEAVEQCRTSGTSEAAVAS